MPGQIHVYENIYSKSTRLCTLTAKDKEIVVIVAEREKNKHTNHKKLISNGNVFVDFFFHVCRKCIYLTEKPDFDKGRI